jgi:hypothetical protein
VPSGIRRGPQIAFFVSAAAACVGWKKFGAARRSAAWHRMRIEKSRIALRTFGSELGERAEASWLVEALPPISSGACEGPRFSAD